MNNMICCDLQHNGKNVHIKLSDTVITSVGTKSYETGKEVFDVIVDHLNNLKNNIEYFQNLPKNKIKKRFMNG